MREAFLRELCTAFKNKKIRTYSGIQVRVVSEQPESGKAIIEPILGGTIHEVPITDLADDACFGKGWVATDPCNQCVAREVCHKIHSGQLSAIMEGITNPTVGKTFNIDGKKIEVLVDGDTYAVVVNGEKLKRFQCKVMLECLASMGRTIAKSYEGSVAKVGDAIFK